LKGLSRSDSRPVARHPSLPINIKVQLNFNYVMPPSCHKTATRLFPGEKNREEIFLVFFPIHFIHNSLTHNCFGSEATYHPRDEVSGLSKKQQHSGIYTV
jgi:hypothetical protein